MKRLIKLGTPLVHDRYLNPDEYFHWYLVSNENDFIELREKYKNEIYEYDFDYVANEIKYPEYVCVCYDGYHNGFIETLTDCINTSREFFKQFGLSVEIK